MGGPDERERIPVKGHGEEHDEAEVTKDNQRHFFIGDDASRLTFRFQLDD